MKPVTWPGFTAKLIPSRASTGPNRLRRPVTSMAAFIILTFLERRVADAVRRQALACVDRRLERGRRPVRVSRGGERSVARRIGERRVAVLAHALRYREGPLEWGLPAAVCRCMMSRAAGAPGCEQDTADGDGRQERPPERYPTRITAIPRDCLIHFLLRPLLCVLRVRADGPEA